MKYNRIPNPKYSLTDKPEIPLVAINAIDKNSRVSYYIGRQYKQGSNGREVTVPYVEREGRRRYITEQIFHETLKNLWEAKDVK